MTTERDNETAGIIASTSPAASVVFDYITARVSSLADLNAQLVARLDAQEATHISCVAELRDRIAFLEGELRVRDQRMVEMQMGRRFQSEKVRSSELQAVLPGTDIATSTQNTGSQQAERIPSTGDVPNSADDESGALQSDPSAGSGSQGTPEPQRKKGPHRKRMLPKRRVVVFPENVLREGPAKYECIGAEVSTEIVRRNATHLELETVRPKFKRIDSFDANPGEATGTDDSTQVLNVDAANPFPSTVDELAAATSDSIHQNVESSDASSVTPVEPASTLRLQIPGVDCSSAIFAHDHMSAPQDPRFKRCPYPDGAIVRYQPVRDSNDNESTPTIIIAPPALKPFDKAKVDASVIAHFFVEKFLYHDPFHRQQQDSEREGVPFGRNAMSAWQKLVGPGIVFLANAMWNDVLAKSEWIAMDATTLPVRDPTSGQVDYSHVFTLFAESHAILYRPVKEQNGETVRELFGRFRGPILCDACSCHNALFGPEKPATEVGCWQHCRKPFKAAFEGDDRRNGAKGLSFIKELFKAEKDIGELSAEEKQRARQSVCKPIVDNFFAWVHDQRGKIGTSVEKGFTYAVNQETALRVFLENGLLPISNNISERSLRHVVRGRINWLFAGSDDAAEQSMAIISLLQTAVMLGLEPRFYLQELLTVLPHYDNRNVLDLAPHRWIDTRQRLIRSGELRYIDIGSLCARL